MLPPRKHVQEDNVDSWLMSYADMITLLLCFFIIFVAISEPKKDKLSAVAEGLAQKFGVVDLATPFQGILHSLQAIAETHKVLRDVAVEKTPTSIDMELASDKFYKTDSAEFNPEMLPMLLDIAATIKSIDYIETRITVEGHTSDAPISSVIYPSNWELSSARAARLVRFFIEQGIKPERLRTIGYADTKPKVPNLDGRDKPIPQNRAKNQRVVIRVERAM